MFNLKAAELKKVKEKISKIEYLNIDYFKDTLDLTEEEAAEQLRIVKNCMLAAEVLFLYIDSTDEGFNEDLFEKIGEI